MSSSSDRRCNPLVIDPRGRAGDARDAIAVAAKAAEGLAAGSPVHVRLGDLGVDDRSALALASGIADAICESLNDRCGSRFELEWKPAHERPPGRLLPHHDGGSVTGLEVPGVCVETAGSRHAYAGFFVEAEGRDPCETAFYPLLQPLHDAAVERDGSTDPSAAMTDVGRRRRALARRSRTGYFTLPATLGATSADILAVDDYEAANDLPVETLRRHAPLLDRVRACPCGGCGGQSERVFCAGVQEALGMTWPAFRERYELVAIAQRHDLLMWNNMFMQHGAGAAGPGRKLRHVYFKLPTGPPFDHWLADQWARQWPVD